MRNLTFVLIIPALLAAGMSPGRLAAQVSSITPQEPTTLGEIFRVDRLAGAPSALEHVKVKQQKVEPLQFRRRDPAK